jgi:RimJ/RimL family protein N-acetyltransferase
VRPVRRFGAKAITTERLTLVPLRAEDADTVAEMLHDERLYEFIGGPPSSFAALRDRYAAMAAGSPEPEEVWLNWVLRRRLDERSIGMVQATVFSRASCPSADVAWMIGLEHQNQGYASEGARALVEWLLQRGCHRVEAHIHPDHEASARVAARAGLRATGKYDEEGEQLWSTL